MNSEKRNRRIAGHRGIGCSKFPRLAHAFLIALLASTILPMRPAYAQQTPPVHAFPECENVKEELLLSELNQITRSVFKEGQSVLGITGIVNRNWESLDLDVAVDSAVDRAADKVLEEAGLWERIKSGWHSATAKRFTEKVVKLAFDSPEFRGSINELSRAIVSDLAADIQLMTAISASSTFLCVQEFVGDSFSETMEIVMQNNVEEWLENIIIDPETGTDVSENLGSQDTPLTGIGLIVGTKIAGLMAKKVAQQMAGKVFTRIVGKATDSPIPVAGWVIGGALIVWDLVNLPKGSVPQIRRALKEPEVKEEIRKQIAAVVNDELDESLPELSNSVTIEIYNQWKKFLEEFEHVLRLAENNDSFRAIVDGITSDKVYKLIELVEAANDVLGKEGLERIIETGEFQRIFDLPEISFEILRETANPELVLAWAELADEEITNIVETQLYKVAAPSDIGNRKKLERVLALEDASIIQELMQFNEDKRSVLLLLEPEKTKWLLSVLPEKDVIWLLIFLEEFSSRAWEVMVDLVIRDFAIVSKLQGFPELQSKFIEVLLLADNSLIIETILKGTTPYEVDKLTELVSVASEALEADDLAAMINSGQFEEILALPKESFYILQVTGDPALVIDWSDLAGKSLVQVVETGLYLAASPSDLRGQEELEGVLAIEDPIAIQRLMNLHGMDRESLLELPPGEARATLLSDLSDDELSWLAEYLAQLTDIAQQLLAYFVVQEPGLISLLIVSKELSDSYPLALDLAQTVPRFKQILEHTPVSQLGKVVKLVVVAEEVLESSELPAFVESGQLQRILALPQTTLEILAWSRDPQTVIAWADLAELLIGQVVESGLYRLASPDHFKTREELEKALGLSNEEALSWVLQLTPDDRSFLLPALEVGEILRLIAFKESLSDDLTLLVARSVDQNPAVMSELEIGAVGQSLQESPRFESDLEFVSARAGEEIAWLPSALMLAAASDSLTGKLSWALYLHYFLVPSLIFLTGLVVLIVLILTGWRLRRRRHLQ